MIAKRQQYQTPIPFMTAIDNVLECILLRNSDEQLEHDIADLLVILVAHQKLEITVAG